MTLSFFFFVVVVLMVAGNDDEEVQDVETFEGRQKKIRRVLMVKLDQMGMVEKLNKNQK